MLSGKLNNSLPEIEFSQFLVPQAHRSPPEKIANSSYKNNYHETDSAIKKS
jgi:hypothetical protein